MQPFANGAAGGGSPSPGAGSAVQSCPGRGTRVAPSAARHLQGGGRCEAGTGASARPVLRNRLGFLRVGARAAQERRAVHRDEEQNCTPRPGEGHVCVIVP